MIYAHNDRDAPSTGGTHVSSMYLALLLYRFLSMNDSEFA